MELTDFLFELNWIKRNWASDIVVMLCRIFYIQTVGSIVVHIMVFNDQQMLDNEAADQTLTAINQWMKLLNGKSIGPILLPCANDC